MSMAMTVIISLNQILINVHKMQLNITSLPQPKAVIGQSHI
jgi:hypothetical protein